jgi:hypothetical protein
MQTLRFNKKEKTVELFQTVYISNNYLIIALDNIKSVEGYNGTYLIQDYKDNVKLRVPIKKTNVVFV